MKLSRKLALALRVTSIIALGAALVPVLARPALAGGTITQSAPLMNSTTPAASATYTDQLATVGNIGPVSFITTVFATGVDVSSSGAITTAGPLSDGDYIVSGTDSDGSADTGNWTFTLTVSDNAITQTAPFANSATYTPANSSTFTDTLATNDTGVSFVQTGGAPELSVSAGGVLSVTGDATLSTGSYTATGTDSDGSGNTGTWSYTLDVTAATLVTTPTANGAAETPSSSAAFDLQLATSGGVTPISYTPTGGSGDVHVSGSGEVTTTGTLSVGSHTVSAVTSDSYGDSGSFTFTLTVTAGTISQSSAGSNTSPVTPADTSSFTTQIATTGNIVASTVLFVPSGPSSQPGLFVSSSGVISTDGATVGVGTYAISGTDQDSYGDTGTWSYTLTVTAGTISQRAPLGNTVATTASKNFSDQLSTTGNLGPTEIFDPVEPSSPPGLQVSSSGVVTTSGPLSAGPYSVSGTVIDGEGDTGTWVYNLTVTATSITQSAPTTNGSSVTPAASAAFTDQLAAGGGVGAVSFATTGPGSTPAGLRVSSAGVVTTLNTIGVGSYVISGPDSDILGDTGTWSYTLRVVAAPIAQSAPKSNATTPSKSSQFTDQLRTSGSTGGLTFSQSTGASHLTVSASGKVTVKSMLAKGSYTATGKVTDSYGDSGTWTYTLAVSASAVTQAAPKSNTTIVTPATSSKFSAHLTVTGNNGTVKYVMTNGHSTPAGLAISSSGAVSTTGALAVGTYTATGTDTDSLGDSGPWSYSLTVTAAKITQSTPTGGTTTTATAFTGKLKVAGFYGTVTYSQASGKPSLTVSSSGSVSSPTTLAAGVYKATGTVKDSYGDTEGTWSFSLTVTATKITQAVPDSADVATNKIFAGQLKVSGAHGTVTYTQTRGAPDLRVSTSGAISSPANLARGIYTASGTDFDSLHDTGTWSYTLIVGATTINQVGSAKGAIAVGRSFSSQLKVSGSHGKVTFTETQGAPHLKVSSSGKVSAPGDLTRGTYRAKGTDSDTFGDKGSWSFTLTVNGRRLAQLGPVTAATTTGKGFAEQLRFFGAHGRLSYTQSGGAPFLKVSSSGAISGSGNLVAGTYKASGTAQDSFGQAGNWTFTLKVVATKLLQIPPVRARTVAGKAFAAQLKVSGAHRAVSYAQSNGAPQLTVSPSGAISAPATLSPGTYQASGSTRDGLGDKGQWAFRLVVTGHRLSQLAPTKATIVSGEAFSEQLKFSGGHGKLTYSQSKGSPQLKMSSSGVLTDLEILKPGTYKATGSVRDPSSDSGTWEFTLTVKASALKQISPTAGKTNSGAAFSAQLKVSGGHGKLTYSQSKGSPQLKVSSSGLISALGTLKPGTYQAMGLVRDASGQSGSWHFTLTVKASALKQISPTTGKTSSGAAFSAQLKVSGGHGKLTYSQSKGSPQLKLTASGLISALETLKPGTYQAMGLVRDASGHSGSWHFTLTVQVSTLKQISPTAGRTISGTAFTGQLKVSGAHGNVTFVQLTGAQVMTVSSSGVVSAPATLAAATYTITGTAKDSSGDTCKWTFTLVVAA